MAVVVYGRLTNLQCLKTIQALRKMNIPYKRWHIDEFTGEHRSLGRTHQPIVITDTDSWTGWRPDKISQLATA